MLTALAAAACGDDPCDAIARGRRLAGNGATDCGLATTDAERATVTSCALHAKEEGKPYSAAFQEKGRDSTFTFVFAENGTGSWMLLSDDIAAADGGPPSVSEQSCTSITGFTGSGGRSSLQCNVPSAWETVCR